MWCCVYKGSIYIWQGALPLFVEYDASILNTVQHSQISDCFFLFFCFTKKKNHKLLCKAPISQRITINYRIQFVAKTMEIFLLFFNVLDHKINHIRVRFRSSSSNKLHQLKNLKFYHKSWFIIKKKGRK